MCKMYITPWKKILMNKLNAMKLNLILLASLCILMFSSCEQSVQKEEDTTLESETEQMLHSIKEDDVEILSIDGCQYIVYKETIGANHSFGYLAHKGNCNNPIHCYNDIQSNLKIED